MSQKSFEDFLKDKSEEFKPNPNSDTWTKIETNLPPEKNKKRIAIIWWTSGIAAAIAVLFALTILLDSKKPEVTMTSKQDTNVSKELNSSESEPTLSSIEKSDVSVNNNADLIIDNKNTSPKTARRKYKRSNSLHFNSDQIENDVPVKQNEKYYSAKTDLNPIHESKSDSKELEPNENVSSVQETEKQNTEISIAEALHSDSTKSIDSTQYIAKTPSIPILKKTIFTLLEFIPHQSKTIVGIYPDYRENEPYKTDKENRRVEDKGRIDFLAGFKFGLQSKRHSVSIGLRYYRLSYDMTVINVNNSILSGAGTRFSTFSYNYSDSFKTDLLSVSQGAAGRVRNKFHYLSIPIQYDYSFIQLGRFNAGINASFIYNKLLKHEGLTYQESSGIYVKPDNAIESKIEKNHFSAGLGLTLNYRLLKNFSIGLQPTFIRSLQAIEGGIVNTSYSSFGLGLNLRYDLKKL